MNQPHPPQDGPGEPPEDVPRVDLSHPTPGQPGERPGRQPGQEPGQESGQQPDDPPADEHPEDPDVTATTLTRPPLSPAARVLLDRSRAGLLHAAAARRVHGEGVPAVDGALALDDPAPGPADAPVRVADLAQECEVWRVSASPGRAFPSGVYDLCREPAQEPSRGSPDEVWHLARVAD